MSEQTQNQELDFEFDLSSLPDLPEYIKWPAGSYDCEVVSLRGEVVSMGSNDTPCVVLKVKLLNVNEVKPIDAKVPEIGTENTWNFPLTGRDDSEEAQERALGSVKRMMMPFAQAFGTTNNKEIYAKAVGTKIKLITSVSVKKGDAKAGEEDKIYSNVKNIIVE